MGKGKTRKKDGDVEREEETEGKSEIQTKIEEKE